MFYFSILYYYFGPLRTITSIYYIICFPALFLQRKARIIDILVVLYIFAFIFVKYQQTNDLTASFLYLRLYWGFIGFYFFFRIRKLHYADKLFTLCTYLTLAEFVAIRINPGLIHILPNYDGTFDTLEAYGFVGGVHSFGGNRTVTGVLMLSIYVYFDMNRDRFPKYKIYLAGAASLLSFSATAWMVFVVYFLLRRANKLIFPIALGLMTIGIIYVSTIWSRLSLDYINVVYEIKADEIANNMEHLYADKLSYLFGTSYIESESNEVKGYGSLVGDFSYLDFYLRNGIIGVIVFSLIAFSNINRRNFAMVLVLIAGTFHYHVIFSFPGQVMFAYFLSLTPEDEPINTLQPAYSPSQTV